MNILKKELDKRSLHPSFSQRNYYRGSCVCSDDKSVLSLSSIIVNTNVNEIKAVQIHAFQLLEQYDNIRGKHQKQLNNRFKYQTFRSNHPHLFQKMHKVYYAYDRSREQGHFEKNLCYGSKSGKMSALDKQDTYYLLSTREKPAPVTLTSNSKCSPKLCTKSPALFNSTCHSGGDALIDSYYHIGMNGEDGIRKNRQNSKCFSLQNSSKNSCDHSCLNCKKIKRRGKNRENYDQNLHRSKESCLSFRHQNYQRVTQSEENVMKLIQLKRAKQQKPIKKQRKKQLALGVDATASLITDGALLFKRNMKCSVPLIEAGMESVGQMAKNKVPNKNDSQICDLSAREQSVLKTHKPDKSPNDTVTLVYTNQLRRASESLLDVSRSATLGVRDAVSGTICDQIENSNISTEKFNVDEDDMEVLAAMGTVCLATLGAAQIVGETLYETSRDVARKGASVTADVVRHTYGDTAGQVVEDASQTVGNSFRICMLGAMLETTTLSFAVAKKTGKEAIYK